MFLLINFNLILSKQILWTFLSSRILSLPEFSDQYLWIRPGLFQQKIMYYPVLPGSWIQSYRFCYIVIFHSTFVIHISWNIVKFINGSTAQTCINYRNTTCISHYQKQLRDLPRNSKDLVQKSGSRCLSCMSMPASRWASLSCCQWYWLVDRKYCYGWQVLG